MSLTVAADHLAPMLLGIKWLDPNWLLDQYGAGFIWLSLAIVFVECGLFFPFLPGDTLLFALGLFIAGQQIEVIGVSNEPVELVMALLVLTLAAFLGNVVGYEIGRRLGPPLYERDGRLLKRKYFDNTSAFFEKHGNKALVIGRFVPFVRTFITVVAGVTQMQRRRFFIWSFVGALLWVFSIVLIGYFLGAAFPVIGENIDYAAIAIAIFTIAPLLYEGIRHRRELGFDDEDDEAAPTADTTAETSGDLPGAVEA
ncbi:DedA family protein [Nocardioides rubriscoriae]|uniref:DedA family protein n=1 Tax=Nocardioides rubriscoriae TaxID=642762 RepID=UPI001FE28834|nr:VTT domain-containing protein [Nocardioides rubriscoriae]